MIVLVHMVHPDDFCRSWRHHCGLSKKKRLADLRTLRTHRLRRPTKRRRHAWPVATRCEVTAVGNCGTVSSTDSRPHSTEVTKSFSCFHSHVLPDQIFLPVTPCDSNLCLGWVRQFVYLEWAVSLSFQAEVRPGTQRRPKVKKRIGLFGSAGDCAACSEEGICQILHRPIRWPGLFWIHLS